MPLSLMSTVYLRHQSALVLSSEALGGSEAGRLSANSERRAGRDEGGRISGGSGRERSLRGLEATEALTWSYSPGPSEWLSILTSDPTVSFQP